MKKKLLLFLFSFCSIFLVAQVQPTIVGAGFNSPVGIEVDNDGKLWVTEIGTGNNDGKVSILDENGNIEPFLINLPSFQDSLTNETKGSWRTLHLSNDQIMVINGEGVEASSTSLLVFNKSDYSSGNPLTMDDAIEVYQIGDFVLSQGAMNSNPYSSAVDGNGDFFIVDSQMNGVVKYDKNLDSLTVFSTFPSFQNPLPFGPPFVDAVPTKIITNPDGGFYVCEFTGFPFLNGAAKIYELDGQGNASVFADGFSLLSDIAIDPTDGNLTVLQFGEVDSDFNFKINSAQIIKIFPNGSRDTLAKDFGPSAGFAFDVNGDIYATHLFFGQILKFDFPTSLSSLNKKDFQIKTFPNPVLDHVNILLQIEEASTVSVEIFNSNGIKVQNIFSGRLSAGEYLFEWNKDTDLGVGTFGGMYFYQIRVNDVTHSNKLFFIKPK